MIGKKTCLQGQSAGDRGATVPATAAARTAGGAVDLRTACSAASTRLRDEFDTALALLIGTEMLTTRKYELPCQTLRQNLT